MGRTSPYRNLTKLRSSTSAKGRRPSWRWVLVVVGLLAGCNAVHFNHWVQSHRLARAGIEERHIQLPSGHVRYFEGGEGPPLLFLHGFGFGAVESWAHQRSFAETRRVIAPDLYWFGGSVPTAPVDTVMAEADAIIELMDALHVDRTDVVGTSFGGFVAVELALRHPERVGRLVLVDAAGLRPTPEERKKIMEAFPGQRRLDELLMPTDIGALNNFLERVVYGQKSLPAWVLRQVMRELGRNRVAKTNLCHSLGADLVDEAALAKISAPTLVVWGRHDPLLLPSIGERMAHAIRGSELEIFDDGSHSVMLEQPARFNQVVGRFLDAGRAR